MENKELMTNLEKLLNKNDHTIINSNTTISLKVIISLMGVVLLALSIFIAFRSSKFEKMESTVARLDKENIVLKKDCEAALFRANKNYTYQRVLKSELSTAIKNNGEATVKNINEKMTIQFENMNRRLDRLENQGQRLAKRNNVPGRSKTF